jgi:LAS superfamily LD-carboxypeptidase LdcB
VTNTKKKKLIVGISLLAIILLSAASIYFYSTPRIIDVKKSFQFEYGEIVDLSINEVLEVSNEKIYDTAKIDLHTLEFKAGIDYPNVGTYQAQVSYRIRGNLSKIGITINIVDTVSPEFTKFQDSFEIEQNGIKPNYSTYFEASDLSEAIVTIDDTSVDYNVVGDYVITVKAIDNYGNETQKDASVKIIQKKASTNTSNRSNAELYYVNGILVVNKKHALPSGYAPGENATAGAAIRLLISDMKSLGFNISNSYSGYRSFTTQANLYQSYVDRYGQIQADTFSARAGYSEHQTGLAFDLKNSSGSLIQSGTNEAIWVAENANRYGFIVRYLQGKESITGYKYEPWHLRYIGDEATSIYNSGKTLEEYLGIEGGGYDE